VPQATIDPVMMAARFVVDVQSVVSREKDPTEFGVVSIGAIHGGTVANIIPDDVLLTGTIRSFKPEVRAKMLAGIERTAKGGRRHVECAGAGNQDRRGRQGRDQ
jgi:hippurate hydrolase